MSLSPLQSIWDASEEAENEAYRAARMFPRMVSAHEGFAILKEEVDELWDEVKKNPAKHPDRLAKMRTEAIQVAAMAIRFVVDVCDKTEGEK